ncbi:hypothetical protein EHQ53_09405 [Leptospira langatensis]|uniref:Uncharacterized protein n=1 Tax=Leptospira langatensis TaxID=2484983 RepID=A0A5F1ZXL6_9LEPT|nr:hypothetical protein [Leptospira langatensis]TGK01167.1 hypothetical protein EHO57_09470 [Leptospira langatensis]TGL42381.1 hypothetical protein EHQ53_09405 [Leptospira langatensis]
MISRLLFGLFILSFSISASANETGNFEYHSLKKQSGKEIYSSVDSLGCFTFIRTAEKEAEKTETDPSHAQSNGIRMTLPFPNVELYSVAEDSLPQSTFHSPLKKVRLLI